MAEPDQIDFNTVAHALWGVIEGCLVTVSASTASTLGGLALVNGKMVRVSNSSLNLGIGGALDRFDLIVVDEAGTLGVIQGIEANDPVFKDVPLNNTVLASVFVPTGTSNLSDNVVDKRKFIAKSLLTKISTGDPLVQNLNNTGNHYKMLGDGSTSWEDDTFMERVGVATLRIRNHLNLSGNLAAVGNLTGAALTVTDRVTGSNIIAGTALPGTALPGTIFQNESTGRIYVRQGGFWKEIATTEATVPVGTIILSAQPKTFMTPLGWVPLDGATISETQYPSLFAIAGLGTITGAAGSRSMKLHDATNRVLLTNWTKTVMTEGGPATNKITLAVAQMPAHDHDVTVTNGGGGKQTVGMSREGSHVHSMVAGGNHIHWVNEHPHVHEGMDNYGTPAPVIAVAWGGRNKIDALFNDRNHTYSVEKAQWTMPAIGEVDVLEQGSQHSHTLNANGDHTHTGTVSDAPIHTHPVTEVTKGSGAEIDITPAYITVFAYVRS